MQAHETKVQKVIEGTTQYVIPLFQRTYSWEKKHWEALWRDMIELCEAENPRTHFIGSIVTMQTVSVPEGVAKYLLIDGQQRLTTIFILLTLLRNKAKDNQNEELAEEISNTFLVNQYKKDNDYFKLMPTQVDRNAYRNLINGVPDKTDNQNQIVQAYSFFEKKLKQVQLKHETIMKIITNYFSLVSIMLDADENPQLVFESLNGKGMTLEPADLIRNYFFMCIHVNKQEEVYKNYWEPMQTSLGDKLTEYIRHFSMKGGSIVKQPDVYYALKEKVTPANAIDYLKELCRFSKYYQCLINPEFEQEEYLRKYFHRLNRIEVTTAYPFLLNIYGSYIDNKITKDDFIAILRILENYLIRRFVCNVATNQLNKIFPSVYPQLIAKYPDNIVEGVKTIMQSKGYPKDSEFLKWFKEARFYGAGGRQVKTKLILEIIEEQYGHKEEVPVDNLTIEHIMPQTLSKWWEAHLGEEWEGTHELLLHTIGNLTLTAYNTELSNDDFESKKKTFNQSHLELNKYFVSLSKWTHDEIEQRADALAKTALLTWNYFGQAISSISNMTDVTGTTPISLKILGQKLEVKSWRDVLEQTLNTIADLEPDKFDIIASSFPRYLGKAKSKFRETRQLLNGYFIEVNLSAQNIRKFCYQAIETIELTSDEWEVIF